MTWPIRADRRIQLSAIARGRHLVENGSNFAAHSTCRANRLASAKPTSKVDCTVVPPSVSRQRVNGMVATSSRAAPSAAIASAVSSFDRNRSTNGKQPHFSQLGEKFVNVGRDFRLVTLILFSQSGKQAIAIARPVDHAPRGGGGSGQ